MIEHSWDIDEPMFINIKYGGINVMKISICEVIENCRRRDVMAHVRECDRTPWLVNWAADEIVEILKGSRIQHD